MEHSKGDMLWHETANKLQEVLATVFPGEVWDDGTQNTAKRILKYWYAHVPKHGMDFELTTFPSTVNQLVVVNNIEFSSLCAHHLLPFWGIAHVGYIPNRLMVGLSKIPRVVDHFAHRPQTQENLTAQVAHYLKDKLSAHGVAVTIMARHTCMACRGVRKHNGHMTTSEMRGVFLTSGEARAEFLAMMNSQVSL